MSKTVLWIVVGVLAAAGLAAVAFMEFGPRGEPAAAAPAPASSASAPKIEPAVAATPVGATASGAASTTVAAALPSAPTIDELIQNVAAYDGAPISLSGTILTQCTAGCEFALDDGTGVLSVQLEGKGKDRLIPLGKVGKKIAVRGTFRASPRPQIVIEDPNGWQFAK
jgi:hypothetical protein